MYLDRFLLRVPSVRVRATDDRARRRASTPEPGSPRSRTYRELFGGVDRVFGVPISV